MQVLFQYIWAPIAVYFTGYILLRVMGKKAVSEMTSIDLLVVLILGTVISEPIVTKRLGIAAYYAVVITIVYFALSKLSLKTSFKKFLTASPTVLVRNGDIDERALRKVRISTEELLAFAREKGYTTMKDLDLVVLEETGKMTAIPKAEKRPLQPSDIQLSPSPTFIPIPLIIDGEIIEHNLKFLKKTKDWLFKQLGAYDLNRQQLDQVTLATYNAQGFIDVDTTNRHDSGSGIYSYKPGNQN